MALNDLAALVEAYSPTPEETGFRLDILDLIATQGVRCLYRDCFNPGHITGSALLISRDGRKTLLNHHKSLNKWLCFGGHADGDSDITAVAARELAEESGYANADLLGGGIWDMDIHPIPANDKKGEPGHLHHDIRFLFRLREDAGFTVSDESLGLEWVDYDAAMARVTSAGMRRLLRKWKEMEL